MAKYRMLKSLIYYEDESRKRHDYDRGEILIDPPDELVKICIGKGKPHPIMEKITVIPKFMKSESIATTTARLDVTPKPKPKSKGRKKRK